MRRKVLSLTQKEMLHALRLRRRGIGDDVIAAVFENRVPLATVTREINLTIELRRKRYRDKRREARVDSPVKIGRPTTAPCDLAMRARQRIEDSRDLTAEVCGDPIPGRSALDRHREWKPYAAVSLAHN